MSSSVVKVVLAAWLALPLTALDWWIAWSHLPERVIMKVGAGGQPASYATREAAMGFDLVFLACVLGFLTVLSFAVSFVQPERAPKVAVAALGCGAFVFLLLNGVLWLLQVT